MAGLTLVKEMCETLSIDEKSCTIFLKEVLRISGKDLRCTPFVRSILESMKGKRRDEISKALDFLKRKYVTTKEFIHPNYFIAILKNNKLPSISQEEIDDVRGFLNWGKSI